MSPNGRPPIPMPEKTETRDAQKRHKDAGDRTYEVRRLPEREDGIPEPPAQLKAKGEALVPRVR